MDSSPSFIIYQGFPRAFSHTPRATSLLTEASMVTRCLYGPRPQGNNVRRCRVYAEARYERRRRA